MEAYSCIFILPRIPSGLKVYVFGSTFETSHTHSSDLPKDVIRILSALVGKKEAVDLL